MEAYPDVAALGAHMQTVGGLLGRVMEHATLEKVEVLGVLPDEAKAGFAAFNPTYLEDKAVGFTR